MSQEMGNIGERRLFRAKDASQRNRIELLQVDRGNVRHFLGRELVCHNRKHRGSSMATDNMTLGASSGALDVAMNRKKRLGRMNRKHGYLWLGQGHLVLGAGKRTAHHLKTPAFRSARMAFPRGRVPRDGG